MCDEKATVKFANSIKAVFVGLKMIKTNIFSQYQNANIKQRYMPDALMSSLKFTAIIGALHYGTSIYIPNVKLMHISTLGLQPTAIMHKP